MNPKAKPNRLARMLEKFAPGKSWKILYWSQWLLLGFLTFQVARAPYGGHYGIFTTAGKYLFSGQNPYGVDWGFGGFWFYSPVCGWFFGLLNYLPASLGIFVFNFLSHFLLLEGMRRHLLKLGEKARTNLYLTLLILMSAGEFIGAYQHIRPEMIFLGLLLIIYDLSFSRPVWSALLGALIINMKWFPLAAIGLLAIAHVKERKYLFPVLVPVFLVFWFALPFIVYDFDFAKSLYFVQQQTLQDYVDRVYDDFFSVFGLLKHTFGVATPKSWVTPVLAIAGILVSALFWFFPKQRNERLVFGVSLGMLYTVSFNLLSQSSAFCLATPALALGLYFCFAGEKKEKWVAIGVTVFYWVVVSAFFSDLVPHAWRDFCRDARIKSLGSLVLMGYLIFRLKSESREQAIT